MMKLLIVMKIFITLKTIKIRVRIIKNHKKMIISIDNNNNNNNNRKHWK